MQKEKSLAEKIASYTAMAAGILAVSKPADAQVIYTDVIPDTTIQNGTYGLDLNNDGVTDFNLTHVASNGVDIVLIAPSGSLNAFANESVTIGPYNVPSPDTLNFGDTINQNLNWQQIIPATSTSSGAGSNSFVLGINLPQYGIAGGNWFDAGEHYLGLRFKIGTADYYGWARVILGESAGQFTLKDYAYYDDSSKSILAGQEFSDAVREIKQSEADLYKLFIQDNKLAIKILNMEIMGGKINVMNTAGQVVYSTILDKNEFTLDLKSLANGIYFLRAGNDEHSQTKKILINR
ncbi:MAG: T9SS type A sorting domain-containing protein [Bacteroidota bacterium]